jgi:hypothetical protein
LIYVFEVAVHPGYSAEAYAEAWVAASEIIQRSPGARGTRLHRSLEDPSRLIAIASWDSKDDREKSAAVVDAAVKDIIASQAPFVDIRIIGEFDDPEWVVEAGH